MSSLVLRILLAVMLAFSPGVCCCSFAGLGAAKSEAGRAGCGAALNGPTASASARAAGPCCRVADSAPAPARDDGRECHCHDQAKVAPKSAKLVSAPVSGGGATLDLVPLGLPSILIAVASLPDASRRCFESLCNLHPPALSLVAQHCLLLI